MTFKRFAWLIGHGRLHGAGVHSMEGLRMGA